MKKLHKFLIKSFLPPFVATFFIAMFILLMQFLWKWIDDLIGKGLEIDIILQLIFYYSSTLIPLALPIATLIASIMTFGSLGENNELAALKSSGISLLRIMAPLLFVAIFIAASSLLYSNYIVPIANLKFSTLIHDIQKKKPALNIREGEIYKEIEGYNIKVDRKEFGTNKLYGIYIQDHTSAKKNDKVIIAESGEMNLTENEQYLELKLFNGYSYVEIFDEERDKKYPHQKIEFKENIIRFDLKKFGLNRSEESIYKNHYVMLSISQLQGSIDSLNLELLDKKKYYIDNYIEKFHLNNHDDSLYNTHIEEKYKKEVYEYAISNINSEKSIITSNNDDISYKESIIARHKIEWHRKFSLAFACIVLFVIGASLGSIIKKGGFGPSVLVSILFFVIFHVLNMIGEKNAKEMILDPLIGMWAGNIIFFPISLLILIFIKRINQLFPN